MPSPSILPWAVGSTPATRHAALKARKAAAGAFSPSRQSRQARTALRYSRHLVIGHDPSRHSSASKAVATLRRLPPSEICTVNGKALSFMVFAVLLSFLSVASPHISRPFNTRGRGWFPWIVPFCEGGDECGHPHRARSMVARAALGQVPLMAGDTWFRACNAARRMLFPAPAYQKPECRRSRQNRGMLPKRFPQARSLPWRIRTSQKRVPGRHRSRSGTGQRCRWPAPNPKPRHSRRGSTRSLREAGNAAACSSLLQAKEPKRPRAAKVARSSPGSPATGILEPVSAPLQQAVLAELFAPPLVRMSRQMP